MNLKFQFVESDWPAAGKGWFPPLILARFQWDAQRQASVSENQYANLFGCHYKTVQKHLRRFGFHLVPNPLDRRMKWVEPVPAKPRRKLREVKQLEPKALGKSSARFSRTTGEADEKPAKAVRPLREVKPLELKG